MFLHLGAQLFRADVFVVLCGDDNRVDALRRSIGVLDAHLALAVGPQEVERSFPADVAQAVHQFVRHHDRQRHQLRRLVAGVAKHEPLVAGAACVHAHRDIGRLRLDRVQDAARLGVESVGGVGVADAGDHPACHLRNVHIGRRRDLAGHHYCSGRNQNLTGDSAGRILGQHSVEHAVRYLVGDLVRMSLGNRLRGEYLSHVSIASTPQN